jgi:sulfate/thiosulfate transport system permease protein
VIPGFGITLGLTLMWLSLMVLIPLSGLVLKAATLGISGFFDSILTARVLAALKLSFGLSLIAAAINVVLGLLIAWVLVRYEFPLRRILSAMVDIPFALPTAVAGIALTTLYAPNGALGFLFGLIGLKISFTPLGILVALIFIGLPFVVRTVEPVLADIDLATEEAAACLGATRLATFWRIILPAILPALLTGFALAFARAVGEYGSVIFIAGNIPYVSEIAPLLIVQKLEENDYAGATAIAAIMLLISFAALLAINLIQAFTLRRSGHV